MDKLMQRKGLLAGGMVGLAVLAYLAFGVFGVHTLFVDETVDEAGPVFSADPTPSTAPVTANAVAEPDDAPTTTTTPPVTPDEVIVLVEGSFIGRAHPTAGVASVLSDGSVQRFLRFEEFETDNGPDLFVYLTTADAAADDGLFGTEGEFVDLGQLKGNIGDQNYEIPEDVDLDKFNTVVIWCRRFSVSFGAADIR